MGRVDEIKSKIESLVEEGDVRKGEIIEVLNLPKGLMILVYGCFVGNRDYKLEKKAIIDSDNPSQETYNLYLKYMGSGNAQM